MTPLIVIVVLLVLFVFVSGSVMHRNRRDWQATRKYHHALDTLGKLNESDRGRRGRRARRRAAALAARPDPLRQAAERRLQQASDGWQEDARQRAVRQAIGRRPPVRIAPGVLERAAHTGRALEGFKILGPASGGALADDGVVAGGVVADGVVAGGVVEDDAVVEDGLVMRGRADEPGEGVPGAWRQPAVTVHRVGDSDDLSYAGEADGGADPWLPPWPDAAAVDGVGAADGLVPDGVAPAARVAADRRAPAGVSARRRADRPMPVFGAGEAAPGDRPPPPRARVAGGRGAAGRKPRGVRVAAGKARPAAGGGRGGGGGGVRAAAATTRSSGGPRRRTGQHRPAGRNALVAAGAAVVLAGAAVGAYEVSGGSPKLPSSPAASKRLVTQPHRTKVAGAPTTTVAAPAPTTTVPPFTLVSNTAGTASYQLTGSPSVVVSAQGPCWVEVHQSNAQGNMIFAATLAPGQSQTFQAPVFIRLGRPPAVTVTVNGVALPALVTGGAPWNLDLQ